MKLARIEWHGLSRVAVVLGEELVDLTAQLGSDMDDVAKLLSLGDAVHSLIRGCVNSSAPRLPVQSVKLCAPVLRLDKVLGVGMNYHSFVAAARSLGISVPTERLWFYRPRTCITGPYDDVWLPRGACDFDYEAELVVVIGRRCRHVAVTDAPAVVAGFTIANDLTLRERALKSVVLGKSFDTHTPLGPWIVTPEEIDDLRALPVRAWVNGELRQQSTTADMIAGCYELIAEISSACTLNPGDIILTGTPAGCGIFQRPPVRLAAGDVVKIEIGGVGMIENRVIDEPPVTARACGS